MSTPPVAHRAAARRGAASSSFAMMGFAMIVSVMIAALGACSSNAGTASPTSEASPDTTGISADTTTPAPESTTSTSTTTTTLPPTTTTEPLVVAPGVVKVADASGVNGAAGVLSNEFGALGFQMRDATNAAGIDEDLQVSKIYVMAGSEPVAESISRLMGGIEVLRMPTPAWITNGTAGLGDATVLVMLGHDLAGKPLSAMAG